MHYHNIQDEPGSLLTYCADHGKLLMKEYDEPLTLCDCEGYNGVCEICEVHDA